MVFPIRASNLLTQWKRYHIYMLLKKFLSDIAKSKVSKKLLISRVLRRNKVIYGYYYQQVQINFLKFTHQAIGNLCNYL
jgi:hypothetical protein